MLARQQVFTHLHLHSYVCTYSNAHIPIYDTGPSYVWHATLFKGMHYLRAYYWHCWSGHIPPQVLTYPNIHAWKMFISLTYTYLIATWLRHMCGMTLIWMAERLCTWRQVLSQASSIYVELSNAQLYTATTRCVYVEICNTLQHTATTTLY